MEQHCVAMEQHCVAMEHQYVAMEQQYVATEQQFVAITLGNNCFEILKTFFIISYCGKQRKRKITQC